ncbi:MAG: single-stranded-DNA-specific exonuclease RecJ, partial [Paracoccaceae bacterium]
FGAAAPAPRFVLPEVTLTSRRIGESHLRLSIRNPGGQPLEAVAFGAFDSPLGPALENPGTQPFHLAGKIEVNTWGGRSRVQLRLDDAARA